MEQSENRVLDGYLKLNPSFRDLADTKAWSEFAQVRLRILRDRIHLPPQAFSGRAVLDLGSGTGEKSVVYAQMGANVHCVDFNPEALQILQQRFCQFGLEGQLLACEHKSLSEWKPPESPIFDFAVSEGLLHHLDNPHEGFCKLVRGLKRGGFVVISLHTSPGHLQRRLMRELIQKFAAGIPDAVQLARKWFPEFLERASHFGLRTVEQIVNDNFMVAHDASISIDSVLGWLFEQGISLYRTWPPLEPPLTDPANHPPIDWTEPGKRTVLTMQAEAWAYVRDSDESRLTTQPLNPDSDPGRALQAEIRQLSHLASGSRRQDIEGFLQNCRYFARGLAGVGMTWIVGVKR